FVMDSKRHGEAQRQTLPSLPVGFSVNVAVGPGPAANGFEKFGGPPEPTIAGGPPAMPISAYMRVVKETIIPRVITILDIRRAPIALPASAVASHDERSGYDDRADDDD